MHAAVTESGRSAKRALVCGGRNFHDRDLLAQVLGQAAEQIGIACVIHGCARGADTLAGEWAEARGIPVERFPADWARHGRGAGPRRNQRMLDEARPDLVIAFPGGAGTADMCRRAREAGVPVLQVGKARQPRGGLELARRFADEMGAGEGEKPTSAGG